MAREPGSICFIESETLSMFVSKYSMIISVCVRVRARARVRACVCVCVLNIIIPHMVSIDTINLSVVSFVCLSTYSFVYHIHTFSIPPSFIHQHTVHACTYRGHIYTIISD